ncbi:helix-turn-helix domain protein [Secundilactobacillus pentosiphilus]|uniref:Helix-turn-helix domain protein n=1 Tax=Secundilactobacillus pentosiphilus TaxID=1714682 RepID=A0A1Z5IYE4_9LACO|nr:hypothetical protein [Secundilactobacillus pentosiphilus]GAX06840.1 helix-turn-helix domain protein [Secundilactobacillus pentosiphilus]
MQILTDYPVKMKPVRRKRKTVKHEWRNATEVAQYLHVSKSWVSTAIRKPENPLPVYPTYKENPSSIRRQFDLNEVDEWVLNRR